ncbi:MAG: excinuclease ABC subunit C [Desulfobacterales bacterium S7086C20]|nr:MAG: excinuclease ABC subunit C [Desulfobacterales bacterium S7086C20]
MKDEFKERLRSLPAGPGVYLMKDAKGEILYVGKARNLKKRVASYFSKPEHRDLKTAILVKKVADFDTILTNSEKEAFLLESNLIKRHRPHYNVILRDDKRYPCLRLNIKSPYPNLTIARQFKRDGAIYFGPFSSAGAVKETLRLIHQTFRLRKCRTNTPKRRERPCLNYQMGLCLGPCSRPVDPSQYAAIVNEVILFLKGRTPHLIQQVKSQMEKSAFRQDFESAALYRDRLFALKNTLEKQVVATADFKDRDVVGIARQAKNVLIAVLFVRGGFLLGNRSYYFPETVAQNSEVVSSFIRQYYENAPSIPKEILLPCAPADRTLLEEWLGELKGKKVYILIPKRGEKAKLSQMAMQNAKKSLQERINTILTEEGMLDRIQRRLALGKRPQRIECFDLSNMAGTEGVGAMVVFERGKAVPGDYRKYRIKTASADDDYGMLKEVLKRRYKKTHLQSPLPNLLIVDGGKGQLNMATTALKNLGLYESFDIIGIAKGETLQGETEDKVYKPGRKNPIGLKKAPEVLLFLQRIRDEAHRFVIAYQRKRRMMTYRHSALEDIPEIGKRRQSRLLKHFGSLKRIRAASVEDLSAVPGMTQKAARNVYEAFIET